MAKRKLCKFPMSQFYIYEDEVPEGSRVSTASDCIICDGMAECIDADTTHCIIDEKPSTHSDLD